MKYLMIKAFLCKKQALLKSKIAYNNETSKNLTNKTAELINGEQSMESAIMDTVIDRKINKTQCKVLNRKTEESKKNKKPAR